jgi:hypothetical protein
MYDESAAFIHTGDPSTTEPHDEQATRAVVQTHFQGGSTAFWTNLQRRDGSGNRDLLAWAARIDRCQLLARVATFVVDSGFAQRPLGSRFR